MIKHVFAPLAALMLSTGAVAIPQAALAQSADPLRAAEYVEISGISIDDGHYTDYASHLAGMWRKGQDFAKAQGWITDYEILMNMYPRKGEPDVYLLTRFSSPPSVAEGEAREAAYSKHMAMTMAQMDTAAQGRAKFRKLEGSMLLRRMVWK